MSRKRSFYLAVSVFIPIAAVVGVIGLASYSWYGGLALVAAVVAVICLFAVGLKDTRSFVRSRGTRTE